MTAGDTFGLSVGAPFSCFSRISFSICTVPFLSDVDFSLYALSFHFSTALCVRFVLFSCFLLKILLIWQIFVENLRCILNFSTERALFLHSLLKTLVENLAVSVCKRPSFRPALVCQSNADALREVSAKLPRRYSKYPAAPIIAALSPQSERSGMASVTPFDRQSLSSAARR